ncbi:MAG: rRNA pseudouridine synthase [Rikenellaceae bacterium]|jgi:23S rRNA pseudouridine2605 synthase|nr:rRNA pseudouridine synthase [Rikenellaceae bacterium]
MGDSDFKKPAGVAPDFQRDKRRRRTVTVEQVKRTPRPEGETPPAYTPRNRDDDRPQRRSYNPNFTPDNRFIGGSKPSAGGRYDKPERDFNRTERPYGERTERPARPYEKKPYGKKFGKPFAKKPREGVMDPGMKPSFYPSYTEPHGDKELRLNRFIAMSGQCSRREADEFIQAGDVTVNGEVVTTLGTKISPTDTITFKGQPISSEKKVYILMNKPKGFVTSIDDPHAEKTVMDIVKNACTERIYPVGRLDKSSVGVLLLTNDGDLTERLTHPSHNKRKVYQVTLDAPLTNFDLSRAREGIDLDDGIIIPDAVDFVKPDNRKEVGIEIHSGRNRIVRRIFEELGYGVHKLDRVYFAGLTKKNLKRGQWRFLTDREVAMLKSGRYE